MQFAVIATLFASVAMAVPATIVARGVCPDSLLSSNPQCCGTDVLEIADLGCNSPSRQPVDGADLKSICLESGARAKCCGIPIAGQALLCVDVIA